MAIGVAGSPTTQVRGARPWLPWFDISEDEALFATRGFRQGRDDAQAHLESIGRAFIQGYRLGLYAPPAGPPGSVLDPVAPEMRGFTAEGAAMGCLVADAVAGGRRLAGWRQAVPGHDYLVHVGVGWAFARLPFGQSAVFRRLDPVHRWLALDGLGFHDAYFRSSRILGGWRRATRGYCAQAYGQGVGRALWFLGCADVGWAVDVIARAPPSSQAALWSGLGLAITYAGGADAQDLSRAVAAAAADRPHLAQGAAFAAAARAQAGHLPEFSVQAVETIAGRTVGSVLDLVAVTREALPAADAEVPRYELWRRAVRDGLAT
jgi:hypothetical protein